MVEGGLTAGEGCFGKHMWDETCLETQSLVWEQEKKEEAAGKWQCVWKNQVFVMSCCRKNLLRRSNKGERQSNKNSLLDRDVTVCLKINVWNLPYCSVLALCAVPLIFE